MAFKYTVEHEIYEDLASGRVLYNQRGAAAFPVRLASEIFLRCLALLNDNDMADTCTLFDPLCGGGYLLTSLGFLHANKIKMIYASDIDDNAVSLASKNLSLLQREGLDERIEQIQKLLDLYGKPAHREALESAFKLKKHMEQFKARITVSCFVADATGINPFMTVDQPVDIVITDLPYGNLAQWSGSQKLQEGPDNSQDTAVSTLFDNLVNILAKESVAAIVSQEKLKFEHKEFERKSHFKHGKRHIAIYKRRHG